MTLTIGDDKVSRMIMGDTTFVNADDVWLPVEVDTMLSGMPAIMHYDPTTGMTRFYGMLGTAWTNGRTWKGTLLTLPVGFHFSKNVDSTFPLVGTVAAMSAGPSSSHISYSVDGRKLIADIAWPYDSYYPSGNLVLSFSNLYNRFGIGQWTMWKTDAIVPD